ncbi:MAG: hypothetical protein Q4G24_08495 [Paracoccus sp. (in: a-proteobacteria)]|uniref:hypothetical protein n=1 Tax=Paracoccus sp. TaxID=267 RepID=UPI0026E0C012|nr:hypothetical protein [Paracoccus sp. (in: a-proteobacteria)]MDO5621493.1 hypothetical protein [Paracoccus sp. (in: a-proteobacteria)]
MQINDEVLMAFADGELDVAEAAQVAQAVAGDPALAARVDLFRQTRAALQAAPEASPKDQALTDMIRATQAQAQDSRAADPLADQIRAAAAAATTAHLAGRDPQIAANRSLPTPANRNWAPLAVAASLVLALGIGWLAGPWGNAPTPGLEPTVIAALNSLPSGESTGDVTAIASFRTADGTLCREYETAAEIAVACRAGSTWENRFAAAQVDSPDYVPASGEGNVDDFLASIGAGEPLTTADEQSALATLN